MLTKPYTRPLYNHSVLFPPHTPTTFLNHVTIFAHWPFLGVQPHSYFSLVSCWLTLLPKEHHGKGWVGLQISSFVYIISCSACFMLLSCLAYFSLLKIKVTFFSKSSVDFQWTIWCVIFQKAEFYLSSSDTYSIIIHVSDRIHEWSIYRLIYVMSCLLHMPATFFLTWLFLFLGKEMIMGVIMTSLISEASTVLFGGIIGEI